MKIGDKRRTFMFTFIRQLFTRPRSKRSRYLCEWGLTTWKPGLKLSGRSGSDFYTRTLNRSCFVPKPVERDMTGIRMGAVSLMMIVMTAGCQTVSENPKGTLIVASRQLESRSLSLAEKADYFERRVLEEFSTNSYRMVMKQKTNGQKAYDLLTTAHFLVALAFKYASTQSPESLELAHNVVDAIVRLDAADGQMGYLHYHSTVEDDRIVPFKALRANGYTELFFGYVTAYTFFDDVPLKNKIKTHVTQIANAFVAQGFELKDSEGKPLRSSNLVPSKWKLSRSRCLDSLVFQETVNYIVSDMAVREAVSKLHDQSIDKNYLKKIQRLQFSLVFIRYPTHATDWLNLIRLHTLIQASGSPEYRRAFNRLYRSQRKEHNPLFNSLYAINFQPGDVDTAILLGSYPLTLNDQQISNTGVPHGFPIIMKNKMLWPARYPLPLHSRRLRSHNWKGNPYELTESEDMSIQEEYPGIDFLLAYWAHRFTRLCVRPSRAFALVVEDEKRVRDHVVQHAREQGYTVLQADTKKAAKSIIREYPVSVLISDLDLSRAGNRILGMNDGFELLKWLHREQQKGLYDTIEHVTLHSTLFNQGDPWGGLIPFYRDYLRQRTSEMGYHTQPKTVILEDRE